MENKIHKYLLKFLYFCISSSITCGIAYLFQGYNVDVFRGILMICAIFAVVEDFAYVDSLRNKKEIAIVSAMHFIAIPIILSLVFSSFVQG